MGPIVGNASKLNFFGWASFCFMFPFQTQIQQIFPLPLLICNSQQQCSGIRIARSCCLRCQVDFIRCFVERKSEVVSSEMRKQNKTHHKEKTRVGTHTQTHTHTHTQSFACRNSVSKPTLGIQTIHVTMNCCCWKRQYISKCFLRNSVKYRIALSFLSVLPTGSDTPDRQFPCLNQTKANNSPMPLVSRKEILWAWQTLALTGVLNIMFIRQ